jgi:D-xylonolactonase
MGPPELVADIRCRTGEGPLWHPDDKCVYWMDIPNGLLFRFDSRTHDAARIVEGPVLGADYLKREVELVFFFF